MRILPTWLREFVDVPTDDRQLAEDLTSAGIAVESVQQENGETVYEMDLTTNRVDAMNHYGVAREASAIYDVELKKVEPGLPAHDKGPSTPAHNPGAPALRMTATDFPIVIEDAHGCARYTARIVRDVKIRPSPAHIVKRLELLGSRSINNAADATNYALNELGHPTHAFDLDLLEGGTIIVRRARAGETLKTLDGVDRKLTTEDLIIADAKKPVALAGVMGGFDTMITGRTKNVLIESAWFEPWTVRSMAKRHSMHTDASHRFERGADYGNTPLACDRVAELILQGAGGELSGAQIDTVGRTLDRQPIPLRRSEIKRNLGIDISDGAVERILRRLGFKATRDGSGELSVQVPTWRLDVEREIDLLEELARIYGYNNFPNTLPSFTGGVIELPDESKHAKARETMLALGYDEAISITFIPEQDAKTFLSRDNDSRPSASSGQASSQQSLSGAPPSGPLGVANPLNEESAYMRTSLLPGLINMVAYNLNRGTTNVRLFESGDIFEKLGERHHECRHLGFAATGDALPKGVHRTGAEPYTFFHMKGDIERLLATFDQKSLQYDSTVPAYFHPGRAARAVMDGATVAYFGQLHPLQVSARKLKQEIYVAEIMLDRLYRHGLREPHYRRISKFPAVGRDFSFVFIDAVTFEHIQSAVKKLGLAEMQGFVPGEIYRGEKVGAGRYSVLLHAEFQSEERTLRDDEVAEWSAEIIATLESIGGVLRTQ